MKTTTEDINSSGSEFRGDKNKGLVVALSIALLLVLVIGTLVLTRNHKINTEEATQLENQKFDLAEQLNRRDSIINEWVLAFNEIESDIRKITARENMLTMQSMNPEISNDKKLEILKEIQYIRELIDQNKKRIGTLNAQLKKSGVNIASLSAQIDTMEVTITRREIDITELRMELVNRDFEIGELHKVADTLKITLADKDYLISQQVNEMNKAYVVSGTFRDLKEKGLVEREGGIMGLGAKESIQQNSINEDLFTEVDITETLTIPVNSKSAKLVTDHPEDSYELVKDASEMIAYIEIKNPASFWKISRYAVVEVNK